MHGGGLPERHLGLLPTVEHPDVEDSLDHLSSFVSAHVDIDAVVSLARSAPALADEQAEVAPVRRRARVRIGVIRDTAFQFYYPENFAALAAEGAEVVEVSAIDAPALPEVDALYIGGGFPETQAIPLAGNMPFLRSLRAAAEAGLPIYAECGGLMYLGEGLVLEGRLYPMSGVLPMRFTMHRRPSAHGYTVVRVTRKNPFYKVGTVLRGHEFHYSSAGPAEGPLTYAFRMERGVGIADGCDAVLHKNVLATYTHLHALGSPEWARGMVRAARAFARTR
jgi:cobyrinic acid a,c-diamide synthase